MEERGDVCVTEKECVKESALSGKRGEGIHVIEHTQVHTRSWRKEHVYVNRRAREGTLILFCN